MCKILKNALKGPPHWDGLLKENNTTFLPCYLLICLRFNEEIIKKNEDKKKSKERNIQTKN